MLMLDGDIIKYKLRNNDWLTIDHHTGEFLIKKIIILWECVIEIIVFQIL